MKILTIFCVVVIILAGFCNNSYGQLDPDKKALGRLQAGKFESASRILRKSMQKDPANPKTTYVIARWFFYPSNPSFQIDSAYYYTKKTSSLYHALELRDKERINKFPIDSVIIAQLRQQIDSAAFARAKKLNTELAYQYFIDNYDSAAQIANAIELRDEVSFLEALKINTYQAYNDYLSRYPDSHQAKEAAERYEKLLFEANTKNKSVSEYKNFIRNFPASPYVHFAQKEVFELSTAKGDPSSFHTYLNENPESPFRSFIYDLLFHIYKENEETIPDLILNDSLRNVMVLDSRYWVPTLKNGVFGFIDQTGAEVLSPQFEEIDEDYKCGPVHEDILALPDGYFSRTGKKIAPDSVKLKGVGWGFMEIKTGSCSQLIHKSGKLIISDCYESYKVIDGHFVVALRKGFYTIYTLSGRMLPIANISDVVGIENVVVITRNGKKILNTIDQIAALAAGGKFMDELVFDDVIAVDKGLLLVKLSGLEGLISDKLQFVVPLDKHQLNKTPFGLIEQRPDGTRVHGLTEDVKNTTWGSVRYYKEWLVLTGEGREQLYYIPSRKMMETAVDSIWFDRGLVFVQSSKLRKVYLSSSRAIDLAIDSKINFITSRDSVQFFFTDNKKKHSVFSLNKGEQLFTTDFEIIESIGSDFFIVAKGSKKGVLSRQGKPVVPVEMDAIIVGVNATLSLLKNQKFGLYDLKTRIYVKPEYERNVITLNNQHLAVYKDGFYGVVTNNVKPITKFEFKEVLIWTDSVIWVKKDYQWMLLNFYTNKVIVDRVRDIKSIKNQENEKIVKLHRDNYYGVMSSRMGLIIPISFTDIINLGTLDDPLYFTEKYIEEAGIYIVVYYNKKGELVRKQAYEEEEYERILCDAQ
ncbi:MAG: hypothetical protein MUF39_04625 [Cyclobacteriaceae bacterium]|nr:hypothetical protein [Cyclobacteriaceae bacterium]